MGKILAENHYPMFLFTPYGTLFNSPTETEQDTIEISNLKTFFQNSYSNYRLCLALCIFQESTETGRVSGLLCAVPAQSSTRSVAWKELILVSMVSERKCGYTRIRCWFLRLRGFTQEVIGTVKRSTLLTLLRNLVCGPTTSQNKMELWVYSLINRFCCCCCCCYDKHPSVFLTR